MAFGFPDLEIPSTGGSGSGSSSDSSSSNGGSSSSDGFDREAYNDPTTDSLAYGGANFGKEVPDNTDHEGSWEGGTIDENYEEKSPWEDPDISDEEVKEDLLNYGSQVDTSTPEDKSASDPDGESSSTGKSSGIVVADTTSGNGDDNENNAGESITDKIKQTVSEAEYSIGDGASLSNLSEKQKAALAVTGVLALVIFA